MKTIRNLTAIDQPVIHEGQQYVLEARATETYEDDIADSFLRECLGLVQEVSVDSIGGVFTDSEKQEFMWIANFTGDPDAPKSFSRLMRNTRTGEVKEVSVPNPAYEAVDVVREFDEGQAEYQGADGPYADNLPKRVYRIPPYQRVQLPKHVAQWHLNREAHSRLLSPYHGGRIRPSRPKSNFEPDMSWSLDDMRCYLKMVDPNATLGDSESAVVQAAAGAKSEERRLLNRAKIETMKRLHFRTAEIGRRLPTRAEFEEFRRGFERPTAVPDAELAKKLVKGNQARVQP